MYRKLFAIQIGILFLTLALTEYQSSHSGINRAYMFRRSVLAFGYGMSFVYKTSIYMNTFRSQKLALIYMDGRVSICDLIVCNFDRM